MSVDRVAFGPPHNVGIIDLNGPGAFRHYGLELRDYPGLIPSVDTAIAMVDGRTRHRLRPWQRELHLHAELVVIMDADVARGDGAAAGAAPAGYALGLGIWDNAMVADLRRNLPRDVCLNQHYAYLIDGNRQQGREVIPFKDMPSLQDVTLTLHIPGKSPARFYQGDLLFDGPRLLRECNKLMAFCRGDVFCLGPVDAPVVLATSDRLPEDSEVRVEGLPFEPLSLIIEDDRSLTDSDPWPGCEVDFVQRYPYLRSG